MRSIKYTKEASKVGCTALQVNSVVEAVVNKLRRQLFDMTASASGSSSDREDISVEGLAPAAYLEGFSWNEAKYPPRRSLKETVDTITETIQKLEDDLKVSLLFNGQRCSCVRTMFSMLITMQSNSQILSEAQVQD